nr:hypothetical protein [uncultured Brevundimonas sp.]
MDRVTGSFIPLFEKDVLQELIKGLLRLEPIDVPHLVVGGLITVSETLRGEHPYRLEWFEEPIKRQALQQSPTVLISVE